MRTRTKKTLMETGFLMLKRMMTRKTLITMECLMTRTTTTITMAFLTPGTTTTMGTGLLTRMRRRMKKMTMRRMK